MNLILRQHRQANWQDVPTRRPAAITDNRVWPELGRGAASLRQWRRCRDFLLAPEVGNPCSPVGATLGERYPDLFEVGVEHRRVVTAGGLPVLQQERCSGSATSHVLTEEPACSALKDARLEGTAERIGVAEPVSISVNDYGTSSIGSEKLEQAVRKVWDLRPARIVKEFDLLKPIYSSTAAYGHFGREEKLNEGFFSWEKVNKIEQLKEAVK